MHSNPLKDFELKFEGFLRLWMRYFYNIEEYILVTELMFDKKEAMI